MSHRRVRPKESFSSKIWDTFELLLYGPFAILRQIKLQLILIAAMFGFGTIVFMHYQHLGPLAAFTGSVSTITTIGLYAPNITAMPPIEQVIMVVIFIVSVGLAASLVQSIVTTAISREILREQLVVRKVSRLSGHVVVAGSGRLFEQTTKWLADIGVDHVSLTPEQDTVKKLVHRGKLAIHGTPERAYESLSLVGIRQASTLVCVFEEDGDNLLVAMNARRQNPKLRILMSTHDKTVAESAQSSDIDFILPITHMVSQMLAQAAYSQEIVGVSLKRDPDTSEYPVYSEFTVRFNGLRLSEVLQVAPVVMLEREGRLMLNPQAHTELKAGDTLYVFTERHSTLQELQALLAKRPLESRA